MFPLDYEFSIRSASFFLSADTSGFSINIIERMKIGSNCRNSAVKRSSAVRNRSVSVRRGCSETDEAISMDV
ncbi:hypothetical protein D3C86_1218200 [compost metagenome]